MREPSGPALWRVTHAEVLKLWGMRSSWVFASVLVAVMVLLASSIAALVAAGGDDATGADVVALVRSTTAGVFLAVPVLGCFGAVTTAREFERRTVLSTFVAVPRRHVVLAAKALAVGATAALVVITACVVAWLVGRGIAPTVMPELTSPDVLRPYAGAVVFTTWAAVVGVLAGWSTRSTTGATTALVVLLVALPAVAVLLPGDAGSRLSSFLPGVAGRDLVLVDTTTAPWDMAASVGILLAWCAVAGLLALWSGPRRDA